MLDIVMGILIDIVRARTLWVPDGGEHIVYGPRSSLVKLQRI